MKRILALFLIFALSFQCLVQLGLVVDFTINRDFIAKTFCVNKAKPELKCNGKCHLAKSLKKSASKEEQSGQRESKNEIQIPVFIQNDFFKIEFNSAKLEASTLHEFAYTASIPQFVQLSVFQPPQV